MKTSLKTKLILMFVIFISIPLVSLGIFSFSSAANAIQVSTEDSLEKITVSTAENIEKSIESVDHYIELISLNKDLSEEVSMDNEVNRKKAYEYISLIQKKYDKELEQIVIVDLSGKGIISNSNINENLDLSDREYIKKCLSGESSRSEVIKSKSTGNYVIALAHPLKKDNKVVGVVLGSIKFDNITSHLKEIKVGEGGYAYMVNKDGLMLYHPIGDKILKEKFFENTDPGMKDLIELMKSGKPGATGYIYEGVKKYGAISPVGDWIVATTANYNEYMKPALTIRLNTAIFTIISLLVATVAAYFMTTRNIINPIKELEKLMVKAGSGDLTVASNIKTKDEIQILGENFNKMIEHQAEIIGSVRRSSEELAASSEEMAASSEVISHSAEQITNSIQHVAADSQNQNLSVVEASKVLVELSSLVQIAQNKATTAKINSDNSLKTAEGGRTSLQQTIEAMNDINKVSVETASKLTSLQELSQKVGIIVSTINSISDQTNLLALNAAIEAARAGEHGKGFSVVADEVRKLSEESTKGANEISSIIRQMVSEIQSAVSSMNFGVDVVNNGVQVVSNTDKAFLDIIQSVEQIAKDIEQISEVTDSEVASSEQIVTLIDSVATITETTTANSEEVSASTEEQMATIETLTSVAEEISAMSSELNQLVDKFKI